MPKKKPKDPIHPGVEYATCGICSCPNVLFMRTYWHCPKCGNNSEVTKEDLLHQPGECTDA